MCFFSVGCLNGVRRVCAQMVATFNIETFLKFDLTLPLFQNLFLTLIWAKSNSIQEIAKIFDASPEYTNKTTFTVCVFFVCFFCFFFFVFFFFCFFFALCMFQMYKNYFLMSILLVFFHQIMGSFCKAPHFLPFLSLSRSNNSLENQLKWKF